MGNRWTRNRPTVGDGYTTKGPKIGKAEVKVQRADGSWLQRQTAKLWGSPKKK